jgi:cell division protein ZapA
MMLFVMIKFRKLRLTGGLRLGHDKNRVTVNIYGEQYTIVGEERTSHVNTVASVVDEKMREMKQKNPYFDTKRLAVLTAVNIVSEHLKTQEQLENLKQKQEKEED